jgi:hypothetical protein
VEPAECGDPVDREACSAAVRRRSSATSWANSGSTAAIFGRVIAFGLVVGAALMPRRYEPARPQGREV